MIDIDEAYRRVFANIEPIDTVEVSLDDSLHRTLARSIQCDLDHPPFDRSVMDGYAVRAADVAGAPVTLRVTGQIAAETWVDDPAGGHSWAPGEAMQINTGAPIPRGADAVVRVELTEPVGGGELPEQVLIRNPVEPGTFITRRATYGSAGQTVLQAGTLMTPAAIGAAAAAGASRVTVYRKPTVALLSTGGELVEIDCVPRGAQIRNSNQHQLHALVLSAHAEPAPMGIVPDDRQELRESIKAALRHDVLCITGGVSMGAFDFVPEVLEQCGARFHIQKMAIKPGRPIHFATTDDGTLIFALPGNPVSAFVGFELLVRPALAALQGRTGRIPKPIQAQLRGALSATRDRRAYLPARIEISDDGLYVVEPLSWRGSGDAFGLAGANAMIVRPPNVASAGNGQTVSILLLDRV